MIRILPLILFLLLLTGCWNNEELNESALVHGVGIDKGNGDKLKFSLEIIKPGENAGEGGMGSGENIIIEKEQDTLMEAARETIRDVKRRPFFDHNRLWLISRELAEEDFIGYLDLSRRDQMFRLNSYIFISEEDPINILKTPTLYEDLSSQEIVTALEQVTYISGFTSVKLYEFFKLMEGPVPNAYIPMIKTKEEPQQTITSLDGTAVIKDGKMVGKLTNHETKGLNVLLGTASGGNVQLNISGDKVTVEVNNSKTNIEPILEGNQLKAKVELKVSGTLADNTTKDAITEEWIERLEKEVSKQIENDIEKTLNKLQNELETDITGIGIKTYRKYPHQWDKVKKNWNEVFSNADITTGVVVDINHQGLINKNLNRKHKKPSNNPYKFNKGN